MIVSATFAHAETSSLTSGFEMIENHVNKLEKRIATLESQRSKQSELIKRLQGNAPVVTSNTDAAKRIAKLEQQIKNQKTTIQRLRDKNADLVKQLASSNTPKTTPSNPKLKGEWDVSSSINPLDDSTTVLSILLAKSGKGTWGDNVGLLARCKSNKTEVFVAWGSYMGSGGIYGSDLHPVTVRIGTDNSMNQYWSYSSNGKSTFAPQPIKLLRQIVKSNSTKLVLQASPYSESPITAVFDTTGAKESLATLAKTCNWKF